MINDKNSSVTNRVDSVSSLFFSLKKCVRCFWLNVCHAGAISTKTWKKKSLEKMEASEPKWVDSDYILYEVNSLGLGSLQMLYIS